MKPASSSAFIIRHNGIDAPGEVGGGLLALSILGFVMLARELAGRRSGAAASTVVLVLLAAIEGT